MRILVADDHMLIREALCAILTGFGEGIEIHESSDFDGALQAVSVAGPFDVALLDLGMPGVPWRDAVRSIRTTTPDLPIVILSASEERDDIMDALALGVKGYIPKSLAVSVMTAALELVLSGGTYLPPHFLSSTAATKAGSRSGPVGTDGERRKALTKRQKEILAFLRKGLSNKEIARHLNLSEGTVKLHVAALLRTLKVTNRTQAVVAAERASSESAKAGRA